MKPKWWIRCSAAVVCLSLAVSFLVLRHYRLEAPVFFAHYYEIHVADGSQGYLYSVVNKGEENQVIRAELPNQGSVAVSLNLVDSRPIGLLYTMMIYSMEYSGLHDKASAGWGRDLTITNETVRVTYADRTADELPIGKVVFLPENNTMPLLTQTSSYSSTDHQAGSAGRAKKTVSISGVVTEFPELIDSGQLRMTLNGEALQTAMEQPASLEVGQSYQIDVSWDMERVEHAAITYCALQPDLVGRDEEGNLYRQVLNNVGIAPEQQITVANVRELLRYREART